MEAVKPRKSGVVVPYELTWQRRAMLKLALFAGRCLMASWRLRWKDAALCPVIPGGVIFCTWHNRLALSMSANGNFVQEKWPSTGLCAMISASRDGAVLAAAVEDFGVVPIRGSTSRRGPQALLETVTWIEKGYSVAITPDGPRGPAYKVQEGVIHLAQLTGKPIIPMSNYARWKITLRSWDRFQIPLPFARCEMRWGNAFWVPRDTTPEGRAQLCRDLEKAMMEITRD